jgi:hypothetical protein
VPREQAAMSGNHRACTQLFSRIFARCDLRVTGTHTEPSMAGRHRRQSEDKGALSQGNHPWFCGHGSLSPRAATLHLDQLIAAR